MYNFDMSDKITIKGAREHNLKNVSLEIPKNELVVFTGVSGSGKSSLAFDTIFAEGQRRYIESLSTYARQFLGQMDKPDVDYIDGLTPAISIDQKSTSNNPRSTVGTVTEIYDYLRLLYARVGTPYCPKCGKPIKPQTIDEIVNSILKLETGTKIQILAPIAKGKKGEFQSLFEELRQEGFVRVKVDGEVYNLDEDEIKLAKTKAHTISVVIDRIVVKPEARSRIADSVQIALKKADGVTNIDIIGGGKCISNEGGTSNNKSESEEINGAPTLAALAVLLGRTDASMISERERLYARPIMLLPNNFIKKYAIRKPIVVLVAHFESAITKNRNHGTICEKPTNASVFMLTAPVREPIKTEKNISSGVGRASVINPRIVDTKMIKTRHPRGSIPEGTGTKNHPISATTIMKIMRGKLYLAISSPIR